MAIVLKYFHRSLRIRLITLAINPIRIKKIRGKATNDWDEDFHSLLSLLEQIKHMLILIPQRSQILMRFLKKCSYQAALVLRNREGWDSSFGFEYREMVVFIRVILNCKPVVYSQCNYRAPYVYNWFTGIQIHSLKDIANRNPMSCRDCLKW